MRISSLHPLDKTQWCQLLRATLRECTYLPDPIARNYMRNYVLERYRRARRSDRPESQMIQKAKRGLSVLRRANEGFPRPFSKIMFMSYGRTGKRRYDLLAEMLKPSTLGDDHTLNELLPQPGQFQDGWEPPKIMVSLIHSQMNHGAFTSSRIRPQLKGAQPPTPTTIWGKPVSRSRRVNIRRRWFHETMKSLLPPLPEEELRTLDGLISGSVAWAPVKRRKAQPEMPKDENPLLEFLVDGPQKAHTFREYVHGRPHRFTSRFMRRQWRRISSFVPRPYRSAHSGNLLFAWDNAKTMPPMAFTLNEGADLDSIFGPDIKANLPNKPQMRVIVPEIS